MANNAANTNSSAYAFIVQFHYQSQNIDFPDWITLLTVSLAPLIAHLIAGAPRTVYLDRTRPPWHEIVVQYNPMTIIWRYFAIADRRLRARQWNDANMVAGTCLFWTSNGWDGSEAMIRKCLPMCRKRPPPLHKRIWSIDTLKTVVITLQGLQAGYLLTKHGTAVFGAFAVDSIFMPVAIIGLLRLPAALWLNLSDKYLPSDQDDFEKSSADHELQDVGNEVNAKDGTRITVQALLSLPHSKESQHGQSKSLFYTAVSLRGLVVRIFYISFLVVCLAICVNIMVPKRHGSYVHSLSIVLLGYFYAFFLLVGLILLGFYAFRDRTMAPSTIIPCISSVWYKAYTFFTIVLMLVLLILSALQTRETPCGKYVTSLPSHDNVICPDLCQK